MATVYKVYNASLEPVFKKLGLRTTNFSSLDAKQVELVARELSIPASYLTTKDDFGSTRTILSKAKTVAAIVGRNSHNEHIQTIWWDEDIQDMMRGVNYDKEKKENINTGEDFYKFYETYGIGFWKLKPFEEKEIMIPERCFDEYFPHQAAYVIGHLKIFSLEGLQVEFPGMKVESLDSGLAFREQQDKIREARKAIEMELTTLDRNELLKLAKTYDPTLKAIEKSKKYVDTIVAARIEKMFAEEKRVSEEDSK